eukprot:5196812-Prymnesium_polylepis.2
MNGALSIQRDERASSRVGIEAVADKLGRHGPTRRDRGAHDVVGRDELLLMHSDRMHHASTGKAPIHASRRDTSRATALRLGIGAHPVRPEPAHAVRSCGSFVNGLQAVAVRFTI